MTSHTYSESAPDPKKTYAASIPGEEIAAPAPGSAEKKQEPHGCVTENVVYP